MKFVNDLLDNLLDLAILEDVGSGDHTTLACIPTGTKGFARVVAKQEGVIAGIAIIPRVYEKFNKDFKLNFSINDGERVKVGQEIFSVEWDIQHILSSERIVLNILQRMSGIATNTNEYVKKLNGLKTKILDTRKTTAGNRVIEKLAVHIGGGSNHRMGLYDAFMIKDNHIDFCGGIQLAIQLVKQYSAANGIDNKIIVEASSLADVQEIMAIGGIDRVLLDNMDLSMTKKAVQLINNRFDTESSGMINLSNVREYAECGVDYISIGSLTHQISSLDLSMKAIINK